jgi:hypothetical protein
MDRAQDHSPERCANIMAQQIGRDVGNRVQEGLYAGGSNIFIESSIDQRERAVLVIVLPVPVGVFASQPGVGSPRQQRSQDHSPWLKPSARHHRSDNFRIISSEPSIESPPA